ncbi:MAG: CvpA family protein [Candidatus Magasanikbacteria bacterium]|jgi:membrane protein required for colicin V production
MSYFDIALIVIIAGFGFYGLWRGIVYVLISLAGLVASLYLAVRYYDVGAAWLMSITGWQANFSKVIIFVISFIVINRLVVLIFWFINKALTAITHLPIIRGLDRLAGFLFGVVEGALTLGVIFYFIARFPLGESFMGWMSSSIIVPHTVTMAGVFLPLIPDALKTIRSTIEGLL